MKPVRNIVLSLFLISGLISNSFGQFYNGFQMTFGKNRVQYSTEKIWSHYRFEKFDTYFYQNGKELAINTAKYAEKILPELQTRIEYYLTSKLQFIIYNSMSDMKESNIGLINENTYNVGGVTQVIGSTVILYFNGNYRDFEKQIRIGIATVLINQMVYGEELGANIKNSALLFLPDWYVKGLISYVSEDWSTELDNIARNGFLYGNYLKFNNLSGQDAIIAGHSIWKYLKDTYGEQAVTNIVYLTKITRSLESGFLYYTGMSFKNFSREWYTHYISKYQQETENRALPPDDNKIAVKMPKDGVLQNVVVHPQGMKFAYSVDRQNKKILYLSDLNSGKRKKIFSMGYRIDDDQDFSYPLLAWHPGGELLAFLVERKGLKHLYYYFPETGTLERQSVFGVDKIHSMSYAPDGLSLLISATDNGQSDIFLYQLASRTFERITKDVFDDLHPVFVHNGKYIAFSSNRVNDTIVFDKETYLRDYAFTPEKSENFNIFLYNTQTKSPILWRVTNLKTGNAFHPLPLVNEKLQFLSDRNGIMNRYVAEIDSSISHVDTIVHYRYFATFDPVTDYPANIQFHDFHFSGKVMSEMIYNKNAWHVYVLDKDEFLENEGIEPENTHYRNEPVLSPVISEPVPIIDTTVIRQSYQIGPADSAQVNIDNYIFRGYRKGVSSDTTALDSVITKNDSLPAFVLPYQRNYDVEYSVNQLVSQLDYSFLNTTYQQFMGPGPIFLGPGLNAFFKLGINDLLEDYRLVGGLRLSFNLRNNEYFIGFENFKGRLDKQWIFHHQNYDLFTNVSVIKHKQNTLHYMLQYPFNNVLSLRTSLMARQDKSNYLAIDYQNLLRPDENEYWGGAKTELVFDNTRNPQLNIYYGQRWKFWAEYMQLISKEQKNLVVFGFDYRHYTKIHKNFIFANRIAASTSMGNSKLIYYLGGVDNWLLPRFNYDINISYDQNYAFQALASNMRGFEQNIRNGNNFAVINSELRLPVFSYFLNRPLRSEFLKNFQIVGFGDIGTAWEGWNPFSEDNSLFIHVINTNTLTIVVRRQKNPIVGGFGTGLRTKLLGYFVKTDLAWGVEDGKVKKPIIYLSLSLDF